MTHFAIEPYSNYFHNGKTPGPFGRAAVSQSYVASCADGRMLALHVSSPEKFWSGLLTARSSGRSWATIRVSCATRQARIQNHDALRLALQGVLAERPREEWLARFDQRRCAVRAGA